MKQQNVRVLLASENPGTRTLMRHIVENEDKAVIVAEAENGTRALNLARNMRPDVAIIDSYLPYVAGIDNIPLSRIGGLDIAQSISEEIPGMRVVLLNSLNTSIADRLATNGLLCRESQATCIPFKLGDLSSINESPGLIFANVTPQQESTASGKTSLSSKTLLAGILTIIAGWFMVLTMFLAVIGAYVIAAGAVISLIGLAGKLVSKLRN